MVAPIPPPTSDRGSTLGRQAFRGAASLAVLSVASCVKNPTATYAPPGDRVYPADLESAQDASVAVLQELGLSIVKVDQAIEVLTTVAGRANFEGLEDGLECRRSFKGLLFGGDGGFAG